MSSAIRLVLLSGFEQLNNLQFVPLDHFPFTIGRAHNCELVVDSTQISRQHVRLERQFDQVTITDLGSTNGSAVNGERLTAQTPHRLRAGDKIMLGNTVTIEFDDPGTTLQARALAASAGLTLDEDGAQVLINGQQVEPQLSPGQFMLLQLLVRHEGRVVTREAVKQYVWGVDEDINDQTIDALVSRLRKRLNEADPQFEYVVTRRGFGLMFHNRDLQGGVPQPQSEPQGVNQPDVDAEQDGTAEQPPV